MKKLILLIALAAAGCFAYARFQNGNPEHIEKPVYAELRVDTKVGSRELNLVLFGEMADDVDCHERFDRAWNEIIEGCPDCSMRLSSCRELEPRYQRMFDDVPIHSTYLSFTSDEGDTLCNALRQQFQTRYKGTVACIRGRRD